MLSCLIKSSKPLVQQNDVIIQVKYNKHHIYAPRLRQVLGEDDGHTERSTLQSVIVSKQQCKIRGWIVRHRTVFYEYQ